MGLYCQFCEETRETASPFLDLRLLLPHVSQLMTHLPAECLKVLLIGKEGRFGLFVLRDLAVKVSEQLQYVGCNVNEKDK